VSADYECGECPSPGINYVVLLALSAIVVFVIAYLVTETLKKKVGHRHVTRMLAQSMASAAFNTLVD